MLSETCNKIEQRLSCAFCGYPECEAGGSGDHLGPCSEEFIQALEMSLAYCEIADDIGSIVHEMGRWQEWIKTWPPIFDKHGGI